MVTAGVLAGRGELSATLAILAGALGSISGASLSYFIGRRGGRALLLRYGSRVGLTEDRLDKVEVFFQRWGAWAVLVGRVISGVRALISYPAGFFEMPIGRFLVATVIGALIWPILTVELGQTLGRHWKDILASLEVFGPWIIGGAVLLLVGFLYYRYRKGKKSPS